MEVTVGSWVKPGRPSHGPVLALDTSTERAAVALARPDAGPLIAAPASTRQHARGLVRSIRDLLHAGHVQIDELAAIGVGLGPGSFTGLRIGLTAAKTLAYAVGCPLYAIDSLEAIARNASEDALAVLVVGDAQRGDLFHASFAREASGVMLRRLGPNGLAPGVEIAASIAPGTLVLGPPLGRWEPDWPPTVVRGDPSTAYPDGVRLLDLTRERIEVAPPDEPWFLEPLYARPSAAEEKAAPISDAHEGPAA